MNIDLNDVVYGGDFAYTDGRNSFYYAMINGRRVSKVPLNSLDNAIQFAASYHYFQTHGLLPK